MKNRLVSLLFLLTFMSGSSAFQRGENENNMVPGRLIIQLNGDLEDLHSQFQKAGIKSERCLSVELGIWLLGFDSEKHSTSELLSLLRNDKNISLAQAEHYISSREKFPNDPSFAMQWALYNIGQTGGVVDADIDATLAWEVNVNDGITVMGDTIVIAVVDDGFYLAHEDMNYWKNRNEIPDNNIDDDNNGYIDDYDGWNAYTGTGEIISKSHGTRVAGIAGAVGNNQTGICGVGWNGKLLPVAGSSTFEATVVEAFAYVYKMRSLYDATNGESGAYIVATNGSFGVDFANPDDYPIWHMMYDSLGSLGILNAAATMNHASDVDIVGDVPTSFDTDFLIGITNTTKSDVKYNTAAWGAVSIDLGAPGTNILTTASFNTYGYSTGTSMAAPQVSGSIGLLFACADSVFLQKYHEEPEETAIFLKNIILEGVDTLEGFDTLCVSGGRLNVNNAVELLLNPRMEIPIDTLSVDMGQDTTANRSVLLSNLVGFELAYYCEFQSLPEWIGYYNATGYIPEYGHENLGIGFRTEGLDFGTYYSVMEISDAGGWIIPLVLELNVIDDLGLEDPSCSFGVHAYPNPFDDFINIEVDHPDASSYTLSIFSLSGKLIHHESIEQGNIKWSDDSLPSGVYIIHIQGERISYQQKIVKL